MELYNQRLTPFFSQMSFRQCVHWAYINCTYLFKGYETFYNLHKWGSVEEVQNLIHYGYLFLVDNPPFSLDDYITRLYQITPDSEKFPNVETVYAMNCSCAIYDMLYYINNQEIAHIYSISNICIENAEILEKERRLPLIISGEVEINIIEAQIMLEEYNRQYDIILQVKSSDI